MARFRPYGRGVLVVSFLRGVILVGQFSVGPVFFRRGKPVLKIDEIPAVVRQYVEFVFSFQPCAVFVDVVSEEVVGLVVVGIATACVQGQPGSGLIFEVEAKVPFVAFAFTRHGQGEVGI